MGGIIYANGGGSMNLDLRRKFMVAVATESTPTGRLPAEYQEVEYVTIQNDAANGYSNRVSIEIDFNEFDLIEFKGSIATQRNYTMLFVNHVSATSQSTPYIYALSGGTVTQGGDVIVQTEDKITFDGIPFEVKLYTSSSTKANVGFGAWSDNSFSPTMNWYYVRFSKNGTVLAELVPCYRKADDVVGFYDIVRKMFFVNASIGEFLAGGKV